MKLEGKHVVLFLAIAILMVAVVIGVSNTNRAGVSSLGEYGGSDIYRNSVKLEEGSNITIVPSDAHNSLIISSTGGGGSGDITDVGDADTGAAFTADGAGTTLYFEGSTPDGWEVILTSDDPSGADFTATLSDHTGYLVVDVAECWDIEGVGLSITTGVLNWTMPVDTVDATHFAHSEDWGEIVTTAGGAVDIDASVILAANLADEDWGEVIISSSVATVDINGAAEESGFTSGDFLLFYDTTAGANRKVDYDDLPAGGGGITDVGDVSGSNPAFTADSAGTTLWFEGSTPDTEEVILTSEDATGTDFTATLQARTGYIVVDATQCWDLEGTGLSTTTGVLNWTMTIDTIDTTHFVHSTDWGEVVTDSSGQVLLDALTQNWTLGTTYNIVSPKVGTSIVLDQTTEDYTIVWSDPAAARQITLGDPGGNAYFVTDATQVTDLEGEGLSVTSNVLNMNINELAAEASPTSGDYFVIWDGSAHKKVDYDNLPGGAGGITAVGDVSGANPAFTAGGDGATLWFEGGTPDEWEIILTSDDPSGADFTATLSDHTGYLIVDVTECWDIEGSGLAIDTGVLELAALGEAWTPGSSYDIVTPNFGTSMILSQSSFDYTIVWADPGAARQVTLPDPGGDAYFVVDDALCTDLEGTGLSITTGTLNVATATTTTLGIAKFDSVGSDDFNVSSGDVTLKDTAYTIILVAGSAVTDSASPAGLAKVDGTNFDYYVADFHPDDDEIIYWEFVIPDTYNGNNITPTIHWISTATSGDCEWDVQVLGRTDAEVYDAAMGAAQVATTTTDGTAGAVNTSTITAFSPGWAAGDLVIVKLYRDADDGGDTMTTDARLIDIVVSWPSTR